MFFDDYISMTESDRIFDQLNKEKARKVKAEKKRLMTVKCLDCSKEKKNCKCKL